MRTVSDNERTSVDELRRLAAGRFGDMIKAVVDLERRLMVVDADLHADQESNLLGDGSRQEDLWGMYPGVDDPEIRGRIVDLVRKLVSR